MFQRLFGFMGGLFKDDGVYDGSISSFIDKKMDLFSSKVNQNLNGI